MSTWSSLDRARRSTSSGFAIRLLMYSSPRMKCNKIFETELETHIFLIRKPIFTFEHQQVVLFCFLLVSYIIGEKDHPEIISIRLVIFEMRTVPFCCHTDRTVIAIIRTLPRFPFDEGLPEKRKKKNEYRYHILA